jgi:hypothetical protein
MLWNGIIVRVSFKIIKNLEYDYGSVFFYRTASEKASFPTLKVPCEDHGIHNSIYD